MSTPKIRVLLADDHPLILSGFETMIADDEFEVVGTALSAAEAKEAYERLRPDVLVLDVRFGNGRSGLELAGELLERDHAARIIFLSQFGQAQLVRETYQLGGLAFLTKDATRTDLVESIRRAANGRTYFQTQVAESLANLSIHNTSPSLGLSPRELRIFIQIAKGATFQEVADELAVNIKTVGSDVASIRSRLGVTRPAHMTLLALQHGLISSTSGNGADFLK